MYVSPPHTHKHVKMGKKRRNRKASYNVLKPILSELQCIHTHAHDYHIFQANMGVHGGGGTVLVQSIQLFFLFLLPDKISFGTKNILQQFFWHDTGTSIYIVELYIWNNFWNSDKCKPGR